MTAVPAQPPLVPDEKGLGAKALAEARGEIGAIIAISDDGTDMLDEIMAGPVAALLAAAARACPSCWPAGVCQACGRPL